MKFAQFLLKNGASIPKLVERFARFSPSPLSMKQFIDFGECFRVVSIVFGAASFPHSHGCCTTRVILFDCGNLAAGH